MMKTANRTAAMDAILIRLDSRPLLKNINFTVPMRLIEAGRRRPRNRDSQLGNKVKMQRRDQRSRSRLTSALPARTMEIFSAAAREISTIRFFTKGPPSVMQTMYLLPLDLVRTRGGE